MSCGLDELGSAWKPWRSLRIWRPEPPGKPDSCNNAGILVLLLLPLINAQGRPKEISFTTPNSVLSDYSAHAPYEAPQWKDTNNDGDASDVGEKRFPVTYMKDAFVVVGSATFVFDQTFALPNPDSIVSATVFGSGPDNDSFQKDVTTVGHEITVGQMTSSDKLPATVKFYNPYAIAWILDVECLDYEQHITYTYSLGTTDYRMYVMFASTVEVYETLGELTCGAADGKSQLSEIQGAIWDTVFSGPANPRRKPLDGYNAPDNQKLKYRGVSTPDAEDTGELLATGDGICGAWGQFLVDAWGKHGVSSYTVTVVPTSSHVSFIVRNLSLDPGAIPDGQGYYNVSNSLLAADGIPGQNMDTPASKWFIDHCLVKAPSFSNVFFDPSYGEVFPLLDDFAVGAVWGMVKEVSDELWIKPGASAANFDVL